MNDAPLALTDLILDVFRLNGALLAAGDGLVADLGLTSARWQVLGAAAMAPQPLPVASLARTMGLTRQGVQRLVDEMVADGLLRLGPNPHHRRASLVLLTPAGEAAQLTAMARQRDWAAALARDVPTAAIREADALLRLLRQRLDERQATPAGGSPAPTETTDAAVS